MKFRPLHDWVVIKRSKPVEMTASGIIIPDAARDKPSEGVVADVGPGRYKQEKGKKEKKFFPTVLKPGQKVMFIDYMAKDVELDGAEITLIREDDVLGIVEKSGELTVKKEYHVEIKKELPPMVQTQPEKAGVTAGAKQPAKTEKGKPAKTMKTTEGKPAKKEKNVTVKKPVKKASPAKKTTAGKTAKKAAGKKTAPKKIAAGKTAAKKAVPKKTIKKGPVKKTAPKKTVKKVAARKTAPKKTIKKTVKKTKK